MLLGKFHWHKKVWYFLVILNLSLVLISLWLSIEWIGYLMGLFSMFSDGFGCGGYGGIGGWIGDSLDLGSILWSLYMYSSFSVCGRWWLVHGFRQVGLHLG